MKRMAAWLGGALVVALCAAAIFGALWIRQYQQLADDEGSINIAPSVANVRYCTIDGTPLFMDLYWPAEASAPYPVLVYAHGGSFTSGDKRQGSGLIDIPAMIARGYAVAAINYRLMPEYPFPAEVIDAKCAIRFLRAHAEEYALRTDRIGVWGGSAGGHLVTMLGLTNDAPRYEAGENLDQSSRVDAVAEMFGPTDLTQPMSWLQRLLLQRAFGTADPGDARLIEASPVRYVTQAAPPFLILNGEQDSAVPAQQAQLLYDRLSEAGVDADLVLVENANHNFKPTGGPIAPTRAEISQRMADFFDKYLR
jgi:acetyl esterase/lipase